MAPVPLNIAPVFRPWRQAGITHLLLDDKVRERLLARPAPSMPPQREEAPPRPAQPVASVRPGQSAAPPAAGLERRTAPPPRPAPESGPPPQQSAAVGAAEGAAPVTSEPKPMPQSTPETGPTVLPPTRWPGYWQALFKKTPPHPTLVWTYPSLSRDLGGAADAAHRDFLRRLLGDMGLPKGSHAFWPLNRYPHAEGESEQTVDAPLFLSGIAALNPESVILMCGQVPPELGLPELHPLLPSIVQGRRFVVTPHVDDLIREPQRYAQLITFLKAITGGR